MEISVWAGKNVSPKGVATMQTEISATFGAAEAQKPVPIWPNTISGTKYAKSQTAATNPFWRLDLGLDGVPIKDVLVLGTQLNDSSLCNPGTWVHVGNDEDPYTAQTCNTVEFDSTYGRE